MAKTVVGLFEDRNEAQRVVDDLKKNGFGASDITTTREGSTSNVASILSDANIPDRDVRFYNEGVRQGDTLITVQTSDDKASRAADIMSRYNMVDIRYARRSISQEWPHRCGAERIRRRRQSDPSCRGGVAGW